MAADVRAAAQRAAVARRQRYGDSFLLALQLAGCKGGQSMGSQGGLNAQLAQEPPRGGRRRVPKSFKVMLVAPGWPFGRCVSCLALRLSRPLEARMARPERPLRGRGEESVHASRGPREVFLYLGYMESPYLHDCTVISVS